MEPSLNANALEKTYLAELFHCPEAKWLQRHAADPRRFDPAECQHLGHGAILATIWDLCAAGSEVTPMLVAERLEAAGKATAAKMALEHVFGYEPAAEHLSTIAARLWALSDARKRDAILRRALDANARLHPDAVFEHLRGLGPAKSGGAESHSLRNAAQIAASASGDGQAMATGYMPLDLAFGGLIPGTLWTVGGRTGAGKSSLMLGVALELAKRGHRPGIVSCEDSAQVWGARALAHVDGIRREHLQASQKPLTWPQRIERAVAKIREDGVQLAYALNRPLGHVLACVRHLIEIEKCDVIMVDYLQAIMLPSGRRHELVSSAAQQLKAECQAHNVALVLGSQLSRPDKSNPFAEPHASELKESGDIENMSEVVTLLWKDSDESNARMLGKVAKVKWSNRRPRFEMRLNEAGALQTIEPVELPPAGATRGKDWQ
jgi:replicative DNA helicase